MSDSYAVCSHCGAEIAAQANFCRHCGSSDSDGWRDEDDATFDADEDFDRDEYEDDFDYEQYVADHHESSWLSSSLPPLWRWIVVMLVVAFVATLLVPLL